MKEAKEFKEVILLYFSQTRKTSWGKNEIQITIKDLYIKFLEDKIKNE